MRPTLGLLAALSATAPLAAAPALGAARPAPAAALAQSATPPAPDQQQPPPTIAPGEPHAIDWRLEQAGREPRTLDLVAYGSSSCLPGSLSATVRERGGRIEIAVLSSPPAGPCTADYAPVPLTVELRAPVRGRTLSGPRRLARDPLAPPRAGADDRGRRPVPRVTGLSPRDGAAVTRQHGLRPAVERVADLRTRPRVIGQSPASGRSVAAGATVTLFVSR